MTLIAEALLGEPVYVGQAGHTFDLIVTGPAWSFNWGTFEKELLPVGTLAIDPEFVVDTSGIPLASSSLYWVQLRRNSSGLTMKIVPEPGTLVLLATGGLGLLLVLWRRRRRAA